MRLGLCAVLLAACSTVCSAQSTPKDAKGLPDTLPPEHKSITVPDGADAAPFFNAWTVNRPNDDHFIPADHFSDFGALEINKPATCNKCLFVIHVTEWNASVDDKAKDKISIVASNWYAYRYDGKQYVNIPPEQKELPQIFGLTSVYLLSVSQISEIAGKNIPAPYIDYTVKTTEKTASNVAALEALLGAILNVTTPGKVGGKLAFHPGRDYKYSVQGFLVNAKPLKAPFDAAFTASVRPLKDKPGGGAGGGGGADGGGKLTADTSTPAQLVAGDCYALIASSKCSFTHTVSVDSHQYWNVGVNIVFHGPRENKYALSNSNIVTQSHTIHSALLGALDLSPWAYKYPMNKYPYLQVGLPLSGSAFHMPYFGVAQPLTFTKKWLPVSAYGGIVFMRQTFPKTLGIGQTSNTAAFNSDLTMDWPIKAVYGIEVPVTSILSKVKSSVGGKSASK